MLIIDCYEKSIPQDSKLVGVTIKYVHALYYITIDHYHDNSPTGIRRRPLPDTILKAGMYICIKSSSEGNLIVFCGDSGMPNFKTKVRK
jgi:hypothetical protein